MIKTLIDKFRRFKDATVVKIAWPDYPEEGSLLYWRALILFSILFAGLILVTFAAVFGIIAAVKASAWGLIILDLCAYLICIFLIFSRHIRYETRALITLLMCYLVGIAVILSLGLLSGGPAWLFAFAVLSGVLFGSRPAVFAVLLNAASLSVLGWLFFTETVGANYPFFGTRQQMVAAGVNFLALNAIVAVSVSALVKGLVETNTKMTSLAAHLKQEKSELIRAKQELESQVKERQQAEKALAESENKYRNFIENAPIAMYTINLEGEFTYGNKKLTAITGYRAEEWLGKPYYPIVYEDDLSLVIEKVQNRLSGKGSADPYEIRIYHASGHIMWVEIVSQSIFEKDESGEEKLVGFQSFITDITKRKEAEAERTRLQKKLYQVQKMDSIGSLAGGIAHDFNNILFPIVGLSEMLMEDFPEDSPEYQNAEGIFRAGMRASDLVKQILAFSRQADHKKVPTRVQVVLEEVLTLSRITIPAYIEVNQDIQSDCGMVMADPSQIHQVAMNFITNAYHATEDGGGRITVQLKEAQLEDPNLKGINLEAGKYAVLSVSDTGQGMPFDIIDNIFDPYFTTKEQGKGTGLGLSVVYGIVKEHGGDIRVESAPGEGTRFTVYLPLIDTEEERALSHQTRDAPPTGKESILLVDDEVSIAQMEKTVLERLGYQVTSRTGSVEALEAFRKTPHAFDLVVSDMAMPNMAGDQLTKEMLSIRPDIPVIICTGFSERINPEKAEALGIRGFLKKPVIKSEMARMVRKVLDERRSFRKH